MNAKTNMMLMVMGASLAQAADGQIPLNTNCGAEYCNQGGTLQIISATGNFSAISATNKTLQVRPGTSLVGTVTLSANDITPGGDVVPLIYTPSWGTDSNSWHLINSWIPIGISTQQAQVSLTAPITAGTYHILFAFSWELSGDQVASASNWQLGHDVWKDGNDIAEYTASQIASAQTNGYAVDRWLFPGANGVPKYVPEYIPSDAIALIVETNLTLDLQVLEGYPLVSLYGAVGGNYALQCNSNLINTNWSTLLAITNLQSSPYPFIDTGGFSQPARFYRAFGTP